MGKHFEKSSSSFSTVDHQQIIEARYRTAMEDVTSLVVGFTHDGTITCASRGFVLSVGRSEEEGLLGSNLFSLIYPQDLDKLLQALKQVGPKHSMRCQLRLCVDNKLVQQKWDIRGVVDRTGNIMEYQATGKVVLGDLLIRAQLQDNSLFRELTENIPVMIYMISKSKFLYANQMFQNNFGYSQAELLNMDFWELIHPDHREFIKKQALAKLSGDKNTADHREIKGIRKDGSPLWGDAFVKTMRINGETVGLVAAYDITERKMLEEELERAHRELEEKVQERTEELRRANQELTMLNYNLNNIIKNMSDGVILFNRDGSCKSLNPAFEKTWGIKIQNWQDYSDISYLQEKVFEQGSPLPEEEFIIPTERGQAYFLASATPLRDEEGKITRCLVLLRPMEKIHRLINRFTGAKAVYRFEDIITQSPRMHEAIESARRAARTKSIILLEGESGTGKEMFAHAIHNASDRCRGPFVAMNCAAIPRELIGSEMFGYVEGAFTGAKRGGSPGKFELASGGTLFLDEIGDMPFEQQAILLRVIQERQITRIGGNQMIPVDVRIICATNKDLLAAVKAGNFRQDLYYRINVINIKIPPLRERPQDIPLLLEHFLYKADPCWAERINVFNHPVIESLLRYEWPGNVRELQNLIEKLVHASNPEMALTEWLAYVGIIPVSSSRQASSYLEKDTIRDIREKQKQLLKEREKRMIMDLLQQYQGNVSKVAREMGIARSTLYKKMNQYHIDE